MNHHLFLLFRTLIEVSSMLRMKYLQLSTLISFFAYEFLAKIFSARLKYGEFLYWVWNFMFVSFINYKVWLPLVWLNIWVMWAFISLIVGPITSVGSVTKSLACLIIHMYSINWRILWKIFLKIESASSYSFNFFNIF